MKKTYLLFLIAASGIIALGNSSGPANAGNGGRTGAPGEGACSNCHSGGSFTPSVAIQVLQNGTTTPVTSYIGGTTYDVKVTVSSTTGAPKFGFQLTTLNASNTMAGSYNTPASNTRVSTSGARSYMEQSTTSTSGVFTAKWVAPTAGTGTVTFYANGNCVNGTGGTGADNATGTSITLSEAAALATTVSSTNVSCNGGSNGTITLASSGGTSPYTYNWGGGITTQNRTGLMAGNYNVTITDATGQTITRSATITQPAAITSNISSSNITCNGGNNGSITLAMSGGTAPYTYNWGGGITTQNRTNLIAGTYTVTVTDANSCTATFSRILTQPTAISATASSVAASCFGGNNGSLTINATGGTSPYSYNRGTGSQSNSTFTGLAAGSYTVTVTDANACTSTVSGTVSAPSAISSTATTTNATCNGSNSGAIDLSVSGGTAPYTYNWTGGISTQDLTGIAASTYIVTITDANACTSTLSRTITEPTAISPSATTNAATCGASNGAINLSVSGGTSPYTFDWGNGITSQNRTGLSSGAYTVTVSDVSGCTATLSATVSNLNGATAQTSSTNVTCFGGSNGSITLNVSGGTTPYTFDWGNGITTQNPSGLTANNYTVTITDANGCISTQTATVTEPSTIDVSVSSSSIACFGNSTGSISLSVSGGTAPYTYNWGGGITTPDRTGLAAGTYTATITDANTCTTVAASTINQPSASISTSLSATPANGGSNGSAAATTNGGTAPYTYLWSNGNTTANPTGLAAGTYSVTVTDANLCSTTASVVVDDNTSTGNISNALTSFDILPNPNNGSFNLSIAFAQNTEARIELLNLNGQVLYSTVVVGTTSLLPIDITEQASGLYFVRLQSEQATVIKRLVIQ